MTHARFAAALMAAMLAASAAGCGAKTVRLYDGPARAAADVARVHNTFGMVVTAVDGKPIDRAPDGVVELPPGLHRICVTYESDAGFGYSARRGRPVSVRHRSYNFLTFRQSFAGGVEYAFTVLTVGVEDRLPDTKADILGGWTAALVVKGTEKIAAIPEADFPRDCAATSRPASATGATVRGVARVPIPGTPGGYVTASGRRVLIVPKTPESERWVERTLASANAAMSLPPGEPQVVKRQGWRVMGFGTGQFEFTDVPPGAYLLLFKCNALGRTHVASAEVVVPPNVPLVDDVYLLQPLPKDR